jgi:hypothetical protein
MLDQQNTDAIARTVQTPPTDTPGVLVLPPATVRANQYLGFDSSGNPVIKPPPQTVPAGTLPITDGLITATGVTIDTAVYNYAPVNNLTGAALTLLLKAAPTDGVDELTVKDWAGNCTLALPIIIDGNGHNIDTDATFEMVFPGQAVRLKFKSGKWLAS